MKIQTDASSKSSLSSKHIAEQMKCKIDERYLSKVFSKTISEDTKMHPIDPKSDIVTKFFLSLIG